MNRWIVTPITLLLLIVSTATLARDDRARYSIQDAMNTSGAKEKLNRGFSFQFGPETKGTIVANHGNFSSNKKTNAFGKGDKEACEWAFLSAMISFQDRIASEGGNAVVNIRSNYKSEEFSSATEYECGNGAIMAGVTFVGDVVTLQE